MTPTSNHFGPIDHVGVATTDLDDAVDFYERVYGATPEPGYFEDPLQAVRIRFVRLGGLRIELLEPLTPDSHLHGLLRRGIGLYHVCYQTPSLDFTLSRLVQEGVRIISPPKPAVAFNGRRVAFTMHRGMMMEFVETNSPDRP